MSKFASQQDYETIEDVRAEYPGEIVEVVEGGWMVFASEADADTWHNQE